uniref:Chloride channel protein n=1 Tax=Parascaris univalens TaxID=6257 RepID=A0A914ZTB6_PARUN
MHSSGYLWGLDDSGCPRRLNASSDPQGDDYLDWINEAIFDGDHRPIRIQKIVATREHVMALDKHGYCYLYVCTSHTAIRFIVSTFENQRWYPGIGWSARTLPTDRSSFSDESGFLTQPRESFKLPSDGWKWEQPWMIDLNEQLYDKEGWQYSFNFEVNAHFRNAPTMTSFVRRRRWLRSRRYTALCRWIQVNVACSSQLFVDMCAGGFDVDADSSSELYSLFALSRDGDLYWRKGIRKNSPEGTEWQLIEPIPDDSGEDTYHELASISCSSSSGLLLVVTWDGRFFFRVGISSSCRCGTAWKAGAAPSGLPIVNIAMGRRALWVLSSSGKLWVASIQNAALGVSPDLSRCLSSQGYMAVGDGMCRISITNNDQVLGISQRGERMFVRSEVKDGELGGQSWLEVVARDGSAENAEIRWRQVDSGNCTIISKHIPKHWIDKNFVAHDSSALSDLKSTWREQIVQLLDEQHELLWHVFEDMESNEMPRGTESWTKCAKVHATWEWESLNWLDAAAYISLRSHNDGTLRVDFRRGGNFHAEFSQLLGAFAICDSLWRNALEVHSVQNATLKLAFTSENERDQWSDILQKAIGAYTRTLPRLSEHSFIWTISDQYQPRMALLSTISLVENHLVQSIPFEKLCWVQQRGSFSSLSIGGYGIVWAVAQNGTVWVLSSSFNVLADDVDHGQELGLLQSDEKLEVIMETQKYSILSGYTTFNGKAAGKYYAWSDATGVVHKTKSETRLPNKYWNWVDSEWIVVPSENVENPEEGWRYAKKFGSDFTEEKGLIRRREWRRLRAMEMPAPWVRVNAPRLSTVYVQKEGSSPLFVWAISTAGELLCRGGVSAKNPTGDFWEEVCSDGRIVDICASSNNCIWAITTNNAVLVRMVNNAADITCTDWRTIEVPSSVTTKLKQVEAGRASVWILMDNGKLLLRIGICATNPFGEYWYELGNEENVRAISVDRNDRLYAIFESNKWQRTLARCRDFEFVKRIYERHRQDAANRTTLLACTSTQ